MADYNQLLEYARRAEGHTLHTIRGRPFRVGIYLDCPYFIPLSTELGRSDGRKAAERFLEIYNQTHSPRSTDYQGVTRNASYFLALIEWAGSNLDR